MDNEDMVLIHKGILPSHEKEWKFAICNNVNGIGGYYAKQNKSERNTNTIQFHVYIESKNQNKQNKIDS